VVGGKSGKAKKCRARKSDQKPSKRTEDIFEPIHPSVVEVFWPKEE